MSAPATVRETVPEPPSPPAQRGARARIAHVTTIDMSLRYLLLNQLQAIQAAGFAVVGVSAPGPDVPAVEAGGVRHHAVHFNRRLFTPLRDLRAFWQLYRLFRRERFDLVHTHNPKPGFWGQLAARAAGVPRVANTLHGFYFHDETPARRRRAFILLEKIAARCSDVVLSQNPEDIDTAIEEGICAPERIRRLGNGIDLQRFDPDSLPPDSGLRVRAELGIPPHAPVIGFVGRLVREKGIGELLDAVAELRRTLPDVRLLLVGPTDTHKADGLSPRIARERGLEGVCVFTGLRHDVPEMFTAMDVFALPSHREGFPRAPMEAAAMGVPAVVTDIRGCREVVEHGRTGYLVRLRDSAALAARLGELLQDADRRQEMGKRARRLAAERFDERDVFRVVIETYEELLSVTESEVVDG